ncbi:DNA polymerase I [Geodia barretti]|uniref:DNA-directed DNA polymerase n=1 Tax=Geodia barretti TaxID=519541 RepID=A0AA35TGG2_GEOBA|nr:DNA polymerase I [Geodia barretti]
MEPFIVPSGDRDTFQLVSPKVRVDLARGEGDRRIVDEAELLERYGGLTAAQQPDSKALVGDKSDNIPGVPGVGEKTAITLLSNYDRLEGIYEHIDDISQKRVHNNLSENREAAFEYRFLTTIDRAAPVELDLEGSSELDALIDEIRVAGAFAFDTESSSTDPMNADLAGLSFAVPSGVAWYVPVGHASGDQLPMEEVLVAVRPLFVEDGLQRCAHNANYDLTLLSNYGIEPYGVVDHDTMIAAHLLAKNRLGLKPLALEILGREMTNITEIIGKGARQKTFNEVDITVGAPYAAADADCTLRLRQHLEPPLESLGIQGLMSEVELPIVPVLVDMQRAGVKLDAGILHEMSRDLNEQMEQLQTSLFQDIGHAVNINSPKQLSDLLFSELGLPKTRRTKLGYSTDANALESLKGMHPVVDRILEYRQVSKLKSTYADALPEMVNPRADGSDSQPHIIRPDRRLAE